MTYGVYTTRVIVLSAREYSEADMIYTLLTYDLGIISARAIGVRKLGSKMHMHLQMLSEVKVSLVKGKTFWRITGVEAESESVQLNIRKIDIKCTEALARIANFVCRMTLPEDSTIEFLYDVIHHARSQMLTVCNRNNHIELEVYILAKILNTLGYLDIKVLQKAQSHSISLKELTNIVNNAIKNSHL